MFFRIKIIYTAAYKSVNVVQNVLMWRTSGVGGSHCVQFSTNTVLLAEVYSLGTKYISLSSQNVRNEFLGRHNKTAYYITNHMYFQKSSPMRKKIDLAFRELNSVTENGLLEAQKTLSKISVETFGVHKRLQ